MRRCFGSRHFTSFTECPYVCFYAFFNTIDFSCEVLFACIDVSTAAARESSDPASWFAWRVAEGVWGGGAKGLAKAFPVDVRGGGGLSGETFASPFA